MKTTKKLFFKVGKGVFILNNYVFHTILNATYKSEILHII